MKQRNYSFDTLKCLLAFFVVCIHSPLLFGTHLTPLFSIAVPLFFMMSGWFLYNIEVDQLKNRLKKNIKRILWITIAANLLYIIPQFIWYQQNPEAIFLSKGMVFRFVTKGSPLFMPSGYHLWYLSTYLYTLMIFLFLCNFKRYISILKWVIPICFLIGALQHCYNLYVMTSNANWDYADLNLKLPLESCITTGIPYFGIGMLYRSMYENRFKIGDKVNLALIINTLAWGGVNLIENEWILSLPHIDLSCIGYLIFTPAVSITLFIFVSNCNQSKPSFYSKIGQDYTLLIYIMHVLVIFFITRLIKNNPFINQIYDYCGAIIVFIITLLLSYSIKEGTFLFYRIYKK